MHITKIDWLTITKKLPYDVFKYSERLLHPTMWLAKKLIWGLTGVDSYLLPMPAVKHYPHVFECQETGAMIYISDDLEEQGVRLVWSGTALARVNKNKWVVRRAIAEGFKVTRIDLAIDHFNHPFEVADYVAVYEDENGTRKDRTWGKYSSPSGETLYIGSRQSARMLRVYDKGKQQNFPGKWVRFEVEFKDYLAAAAAAAYLADEGYIFAQVVDMLNLPDSFITQWLREQTRGYEMPTVKAPKAKSNRVVWFQTQVKSAFKKIVADDPMEALECLASLEETLLEQYAVWMSK